MKETFIIRTGSNNIFQGFTNGFTENLQHTGTNHIMTMSFIRVYTRNYLSNVSTIEFHIRQFIISKINYIRGKLTAIQVLF